MMTRARGRRSATSSARAAATDNLVFYYAFGLFKTAVVAQQIYYRFAKGLTQDARFAQFIFGVRLLVRAGAHVDRARHVVAMFEARAPAHR